MSVYDYSATSLSGEDKSLGDFRGEVLLIVNTASNCGFTPQYAELEALYRKHRQAGFAVLGFPCNQFGAQEPGDAAEIGAFCSRAYEVTFPMFDKVEVNGPNTHPLFQFLKSQQKGLAGTQQIKWNFTKFLVDRQGHATARFAPVTKPSAIDPEILRLL